MKGRLHNSFLYPLIQYNSVRFLSAISLLLVSLASGPRALATQDSDFCPLEAFDPGSSREQKRMWAKGAALQKRRKILDEAARIDALLHAGGPDELMLDLNRKLVEAQRITTRHRLPELGEAPDWYRSWSARVATHRAQEVSLVIDRKMLSVKSRMNAMEEHIAVLEEKEKSLRETLSTLGVFDGSSHKANQTRNPRLAQAQDALSSAREDYLQESRKMSVLQAQRQEVMRFIDELKPELKLEEKTADSTDVPPVKLTPRERVVADIEKVKAELLERSQEFRTPANLARIEELKEELEVLVLYLEALDEMPPSE